MLLEEVGEQLKQHAVRFDLEKRAVEGCQKVIATLLREEPEEARFYLRGMAPEELRFQFVKHELVFESPSPKAYILSHVICGPENEHWIFDVEMWGHYRLETGEDGEALDDWFWWEQMRDEEGKLTEFSHVLD